MLLTRRYSTVEHYYQSRKFTGVAPEIEQEIAKGTDPAEAFALSRKHHEKARPDWETYKKREMFRGVIHKFKQHPDLRQKLLDTGDVAIIEDSKVDPFWGCGADGKGLNVLGQMLMNIRNWLRDQHYDKDHPLC